MRHREAYWKMVITLALSCFLAVAPLRAEQADNEQVDKGEADEPAGKGTPVSMPGDFTVRARITKITPSQAVDIEWRWGGEGLGGEVVRGKLADNLPVRQWSERVPLAKMKIGKNFGHLFVTFTALRHFSGKKRPKGDDAKAAKDAELELEFAYKGKAVKTVTIAGPDGAAFTVNIPGQKLTTTVTPADAAFLSELVGIKEYALARARQLEALPWAKGPVPKRFAIIDDLGGYGRQAGHGVRTTDPAVVEAESRSLGQLGVNGVRGERVWSTIKSVKGLSEKFSRGMIGGARGYAGGCAFAPGLEQAARQAAAEALAENLKLPVEEIWALTIDQIGPATAKAKEGHRHLAVCDYCAEGYRQYLKAEGLTPADLGCSDWAHVRPLDIWGPEGGKKKGKAKGKAKDTAKSKVKGKAKTPAAPAAKEKADTSPAWTKPDLSNPQTALNAYHTSRFMNYVSARMFAPLVATFDKANQEKRRALAAGQTNSPVAKQPYVYSYALRGNTFLMAGSNLDFFDFYRQADNAMVYETSNRAPQIWGWDSYLCDVGRSVKTHMGKQFGIYVKPHRGAVVQRGLSAISRGATMIYWYTYGPDYSKGDSFSQRPDALVLTSKVAHLIGKTEDVLYGSQWAQPAQVAVVKPETSFAWTHLGGSSIYPAAWENAKWTYSALQHAHVPVDAIDEVMLAKDNLSVYKAIYVCGPNITRAAAAGLEKFVKAGGILYTSGCGLLRDEANQPLRALEGVMGLAARGPADMYYPVAPYKATGLQNFSDDRKALKPVPPGAKIVGGAEFPGAFAPIVGREPLRAAAGTEVLAKFADGSAAVTRHAYGKGQAYVVGFFAGLEYAALVHRDNYDMAKDFPADRRAYVAAPALRTVKPVVDASEPLVEGILLKNPATRKQAVTLMNWAYRVSSKKTAGKRAAKNVAIAQIDNLQLTIRGAGPVGKVTSAMLDKSLAVQKQGDSIVVTLPHLDEGDVLILE